MKKGILFGLLGFISINVLAADIIVEPGGDNLEIAINSAVHGASRA